MDDTFQALRKCIYTNETELNRFRQLVVNAVMATDIMDKVRPTIRVISPHRNNVSSLFILLHLYRISRLCAMPVGIVPFRDIAQLKILLWPRIARPPL